MLKPYVKTRKTHLIDLSCLENNNHRLAGSMFYLAGPMDDVKDRGYRWRREIKSFLWSHEIGVLDPCDKPIFNSQNEDDDYFNDIEHLKKNGLYEEAHEKMKYVAADDYRMVDKCDAMILYIDKDAHMCGSYHENCMAAYQRKPVIVCCPAGIDKIPNWIFSVCRHEMFFSNWDDVKSFVVNMCYNKEVPTLNRWRFFNRDKIFGK